jgi:hypothetical protein
MVYATGPYKTKHAEAGSAHYTIIVIFLSYFLTMVLMAVVLVVLSAIPSSSSISVLVKRHRSGRQPRCHRIPWRATLSQAFVSTPLTSSTGGNERERAWVGAALGLSLPSPAASPTRSVH